MRLRRSRNSWTLELITPILMDIGHSNRGTVDGGNFPRGGRPFAPNPINCVATSEWFLGIPSVSEGINNTRMETVSNLGHLKVQQLSYPNTAGCTTFFQPRYGFRGCNKFTVPCKTCRGSPIVEPRIPPRNAQEKRGKCERRQPHITCIPWVCILLKKLR